jgi:hypothetical protein
MKPLREAAHEHVSTVTIYRFNVYDITSDPVRQSRRWGTREAIEQIACGKVIEDTALEVDDTVIKSDIQGFTEIDFNPKRRTGFQTRVE